MLKRLPVRLVVVLMIALMAAACAKTPPPEPTAQEYFNEGMRLFNAERYAEAAREFEGAVFKSPSFIDAHYYLGLSYFKQNMMGKAKQSFQSCINISDSYRPAWEMMGLILYGEKDYRRALMHLEKARALLSTKPDVYFMLGKIYMFENRCPEAIAAFTRAVELDSSDIEAKNELANAKRMCGKGSGPKEPPARIERSFKGGGKAIREEDF